MGEPSPTARRLTTIATEKRHVIVAIALVACLAGGVSAYRLSRRLDTDALSMLPSGLPALSALRESLQRFGTAEKLYVLAPPDGDADAAVEFLEAVLAALPPSHVQEGVARISMEEVFRSQILPRLPLFLPKERQRQLARSLAQPDLGEALDISRRRLRLTLSSRDRELIAIDPLLVSRLLPTPTPKETGIALDAATGGLRMEDGTYVMIATPTRSATDIPFDGELSQLLARAIAAGHVAVPGYRGTPSWGGAYLIALSDYRLMTDDLRTNMTLSAVAVALLFLLCFRSIRSLLLAFAPLVTGILLTFVLVDLSGISLTAATLGFGAMLIGLGIDLSIVYMGRFRFALAEAGSARRALERTSGSTLRGIATGAITTAAAFLALLASSFPALRQLGVITAVGILACLLCVSFLLAALVAWLDPKPHGLHGLGPDRLATLAVRRPRSVLAAIVLVTVVLAAGLPHLELEEDLRALRSPENPGIMFEEDVARRLQRSSDNLVVLVRGASEEELDQRLDIVLAALSAIGPGSVAGVRSLRDAIPSLAEQRARLASFQALVGDGELSPDGFAGVFDVASRDAGFRPGAFSSYRDAIARGLRTTAADTIRPSSALAGGGGVQLVSPPGPGREGWVTQVLVDPAPRVDADDVARLLRRQLPAEARGWTTITGFVMASRELGQCIRRDALAVVPLGSLLVVLLLALDLRSVRDVSLALLPTVLGILWMLGAMGLLGLPFSFFNIFVLALVQGIGVDYGVHIIHRIHDTGLATAHLGDVSSGLSLAALTTVAGFGSLGLSHYPALASMGILTTLGAAGSLLAALTVLPALSAIGGSDPGSPDARAASRPSSEGVRTC